MQGVVFQFFSGPRPPLLVRCGVRAERWWRDERKAFQIASALGYGNRLSLDVLRELRLILRLMRFKKMQAEFGAIIGAVSDETSALAAE